MLPSTSNLVELQILQVLEAQPSIPVATTIILYVVLLAFVLSMHIEA